MSRCRVVLLSFGLVLAACGDGAPGTSSATGAATVRDSAGIRIVENHDSAWTEETRWRLPDEPDFVIGSLDGSVPGTDWGNMLQVQAMGDRVVVSDLMDVGFRVFDDTGTWVETLGRRGRGPLELQNAVSWTTVGDSLLASDGRKVVVFEQGSGEASSYPTEDPPVETETWSIGGIEIGWITYGWFGDGSYVLANTPDPRDREPGYTTLGAEFHRMSPGGAYLGPLGVHAIGRVFTRADGETAPIPFMTMPHIAVSDRKLWHAFADSLFEFRRIDATSGQVDLLVRIADRGQRVTDEMTARMHALEDEQISTLMEEMGGGGDAATMQRMRSTMDEMRESQPDPRWAPTIFGLDPLDSGHILVGLPDWSWRLLPNQLLLGNVPSDESVAFAVFDADGRWLGTLEGPPGLVVTDVSDDYLVGYRRDEFDVPYIERWGLIKPGSSASR